ncbi:MAG: transcriptional repressor [Acidimicrobiia bacterium]|nr:transcriptional repressor [Acidimicrobiia bacterium]
MHLEADVLVSALQSAGMRVTTARRAICEVIATSHAEHLTAADIQARAETLAGGSIDPSTVYRTLDVFQSLGYLHHVHLGHGAGVVHLTDETDHHHLACESCGQTLDVPLDEFQPLFDRLARTYGFVVDRAHFAVVGRCRACEQTENSP